jgi:hypothetical protein
MWNKIYVQGEGRSRRIWYSGIPCMCTSRRSEVPMCVCARVHHTNPYSRGAEVFMWYTHTTHLFTMTVPQVHQVESLFFENKKCSLVILLYYKILLVVICCGTTGNSLLSCRSVSIWWALTDSTNEIVKNTIKYYFWIDQHPSLSPQVYLPLYFSLFIFN